ncbi:glycosyltransferase family 2 protein [uncultured Desulfosarcina sp.]|uniref:glycosyltransferase family 2 protein n=1 Tax=uncultured Desulfosarcina sp. TaxID=218289 RepID=UPI0029C80057|nr:glycosyltransferase family 2 protein [uncultured Desulfosarcina sp.]
MKVNISIVVIACNEADRIGHLLEHADFADEVIVVDSGSTDDTVALCEAAGARVIHRDWKGYADQKHFAMQQAKGQWVLNLDADEFVPEELAVEIQKALASAPVETKGFSMPRLSYYLGRWIRHGGWYPDRKIRLVRKGAGKWIGDGLHEQLMVDGLVETLSVPLRHLVYRNISDHVTTANRFSDVYVKSRGSAGTLFLLSGIPHTLGKFLECYLWKRGFLDGWPGLIIAMISSGYIFLKHAKAWEAAQNFADAPPSSGH